MRVSVFEAGGDPFAPAAAKAMTFEYLPRNSSNAGFFAFAWDGFVHGPGALGSIEVPDGEYYLVVEILKANGDQGDPAHWETFTTPVFEIDRP
jgi:hypothetical protein